VVRGHAIVLVDRFVAIVVDLVVTDLFAQARDARVLVVTVTTILAVPNWVAIAIGIARLVLAGPAALVATVHGARLVVRTTHRWPFHAAQSDVAAFDTITVNVVFAHLVVRPMTAALDFRVAFVVGTIQPVVALGVVQARSPNLGVAPGVGVSGVGVTPNVGVRTRIASVARIAAN
jgi:hypothetical protein